MNIILQYWKQILIIILLVLCFIGGRYTSDKKEPDILVPVTVALTPEDRQLLNNAIAAYKLKNTKPETGKTVETKVIVNNEGKIVQVDTQKNKFGLIFEPTINFGYNSKEYYLGAGLRWFEWWRLGTDLQLGITEEKSVKTIAGVDYTIYNNTMLTFGYEFLSNNYAIGVGIKF